jgi:3-oxoadipate enol-lactonase
MSGLLGHRATGQGDPPLLLLNGALMSLAAWQPAVTPLEGARRIVRCDFRGQLFSQGLPQPDLEDHLADVLRLLDHLQIGRVHLAGASFGSLVALRLAARHPARIASVTAITSTPQIDAEAWRELKIIRDACLEAADGGPTHDAGKVSDLSLPMFSAAYRESQAANLAMQRDWIGMLPEAWFRGVAAILEAVKDLDLRPELPTIRCPALVIGADEDYVFPPGHSQALAAALPNARLEMVASGHSLAVEQPERLAEILKSFLSSLC